MEKISLNQKKDASIFFASSITVSIILYIFGVQLKMLIEANSYIALMFLFKIFYDQLYHYRLNIGKSGVKINIFLNKYIVPWSDLVVKTKVLNKDEQKFIFQYNKENLVSLKISYLNNLSFVSLVKKYCPEDHELYQMVQEYAKKRNLPF